MPDERRPARITKREAIIVTCAMVALAAVWFFEIILHLPKMYPGPSYSRPLSSLEVLLLAVDALLLLGLGYVYFSKGPR